MLMMKTQPHEAKFIYEVNLTIEKEIYEQNRAWLYQHFHDMVKENGFKLLRIFSVKNMDPTNDHHLRYYSIVSQYEICNFNTLEQYFEKQAIMMRSQVVDKLGKHYSVSRRVLELVDVFDPEGCHAVT